MGGSRVGSEVTTRLSDFAADFKYADIPEDILQFTKCLTLKTVAGMIAGSSKNSAHKMAKIIKSRNLPEDVGIIGGGFKTSLWEAVFLNAFFAHASELEDDKIGGGLAWDITVIPLLLPLAEKLKLSGKTLVEALVIGLEVHTRSCLPYTEHLGVSAIPGALGPAVGAARAFGLNSREISQAMGLAISGAPLSMINWGTDAHCFESALHSLQGIIAAEMAKEGMTSNPDLITYLSKLLGKERVEPEKMLEGLGKRWMLRDIWIKKYPCCFLNHRQIDAVITTMKKHTLGYDDIASVQVDASPAEEICNRPEPQVEGDLQFSLQNLLGAAMLYGDVNLEHVSAKALADTKQKEACSKVKVVIHPDWSSILMEAPARVTLNTCNGNTIHVERMYPIGSAKEPLTVEQFRSLYYKFTRSKLPDKEIARTSEALLHLEELPDIHALMETLVFKRRVGNNRQSLIE
jgi:2-methylcitrate dehydratase PrpD